MGTPDTRLIHTAPSISIRMVPARPFQGSGTLPAWWEASGEQPGLGTQMISTRLWVMSVPDLGVNSREAALLCATRSPCLGARVTHGCLSLWPKLPEGWKMKWPEGGLVFGPAAGIAGCFLQPRGDTLSLGTKVVP